MIVELHPNWRFSVFPTGALPFYEVPGDFCTTYDQFLGISAPATPFGDTLV